MIRATGIAGTKLQTDMYPKGSAPIPLRLGIGTNGDQGDQYIKDGYQGDNT